MYPMLLTQGLFKVNPWYFVGLFAHILLLDIGAWLILRYFGHSWGPWLAAVVMMTTSQACTLKLLDCLSPVSAIKYNVYTV